MSKQTTEAQNGPAPCMARNLARAAAAVELPPDPENPERERLPRTTKEGIPWRSVPIPTAGLRLIDGATAHPGDPSDLGRCLGLLNAVPELREHLPVMAEVSPQWAALIAVWADLEKTYNEEAAGERATRTYEMMKAALATAENRQPE